MSSYDDGFEFDSDWDNFSEFELKDISFDHDTVLDTPLVSNCQESRSCESSSSKNLESDSTEENDYSYATLKFINQALMEDDSEEKVSMIPDSALHAAEKSFYDILDQKHPSSPDQPFPDGIMNNYDNMGTCSCINFCSNSCLYADNLSKSGLSSLCDSVMQFKEGIEETEEFLAKGNCGISHFDDTQIHPLGLKENVSEVEENKAEKDERDLSNGSTKARKNFHQQETQERELEDRRSKKRLVNGAEESLLLEMFDRILLFDGENQDEHPQNGEGKGVNRTVESKGFNGGRNKSKRRVSKGKAIDTKALLFQCVQAMASNDLRSSNELLRQIRWHCSPFGDKFQRLSHYFADSFDARLVGTVNHTSPYTKRISNINTMRALKLFISSFPFMKVSNFLSTQMIMEQAEKSSKLHIIHFGIFHGVQWPPLIQCLSRRVGGPPKLRITGIENPEPGFCPASVIEDTGRRLANYCESLSVPFEYNCVAKKWENISIEDLDIDKDEVLVVASFYRFNYLLDDSVSEDCPRDAVLKLIWKISPNIFIHGIANGAYHSPFLVPRFREAFFHFSALFDMFEANVPREEPGRMVFEREVYGKEILNVIAFEGLERVERPETYKRWHVRHVRAGFNQLTLNQEIVKKARAMVQSSYHKDFLVEESSQWLIQGWKGRVLFALSFWKPA